MQENVCGRTEQSTTRPLDKSVLLKIVNLICHRKFMLWVLKETSQLMFKLMDYEENNLNFTLKNFA